MHKNQEAPVRHPPGVRRPALGLKAHIALAVLLLSWGSIWLATFLIIERLREDFTQVLAAQQRSAVGYAVAETEQKVRRRFEVLEGLARELADAGFPAGGRRHRLPAGRDLLEGLFGNGLVAVSRAGTAVAWAPEQPSPEGQSFRGFEYFDEAVAHGRPVIGMPRIGRLTGRPGVAFAVPIKGRDGAIVGVLTGFSSISQGTLFGQIEHAQLGTNGWTAVNDVKYRLIAATSDPSRAPLQPFPAPGIDLMLDHFAAGHEGSGIAANARGEEVLTSARRVAGTDWVIQAVLPTREAFAPSRAMAQRAYLFAFALSLLVGLLVWLFVSRALRPLAQTASLVRRMARGEAPLNVVPVGRHDELGELLESFNFLYEQRAQAHLEQKRLHRTLLLLGDCNDLLLHVDRENALLPELCRLIVEKGDYLMAWVGFADNGEGRRVRPVASSGYEEGYLDSICISWGDDEYGQGPTGTAIRTGQTQVNQNALTLDSLKPWREAASKRGYQASIALPLQIGGKVPGALTIYAAEPDAFSDEEVLLLEKLAGNLAFGIERLRTRTQLAVANKELQGFTYAASHDLKAPLGRILNFSALLERHYRDRLEGDGLVYLDFIKQNAGRMSALIEDLLEHALVEQQVWSLQPIDIQAAVQAALREKAEDFRQAGAEIREELAAASVQAMPLGLAQVLRNLLENALKYSARSRPPVIEVRGDIAGGGYRLCVRDNGIGFDMAYHERIFEIFHRLHTYTEYPGSGIGLALVRKAMERMGGRVWAESRAGHGASFFIELPLAGAGAATGGAAA